MVEKHAVLYETKYEGPSVSLLVKLLTDQSLDWEPYNDALSVFRNRTPTDNPWNDTQELLDTPYIKPLEKW